VGPYQCQGSDRFIICIHDNQHAHPWVHPSVTALTDLLFVYMTTRPSMCPYQCQGSYRFIICIHDNRHAHPCVHMDPRMDVSIVMYTNNKSGRALTLGWTHRWVCLFSCASIQIMWVHLNVKALTDLLFVYMTIHMLIYRSTPVSRF
jgi:hypothetical protein